MSGPNSSRLFTEIQEAPFVKKWPLGHTKAFASSTLGFVKGCMEAGMDMARARIAFRNFIFILHPDLVLEVLQKNYKHYQKSFAYNGLKAFLGQGLLTSEGDFWLRQRRTMQPGFYRGTLQALQASMATKAEAYAEQLAHSPEKHPHLQALFLDLTREITSDCLFGPDRLDLEHARQLNTALADLRFYANARLKNPFSPPTWVPTGINRRFKAARASLRQVVQPIIDGKEASQEDLLGMLVGLKDPESGEGMPPEQLYHEVVTLFVAGQETTSNALAFGLKLLADHPEALARLREEANQSAQGEYPWTDAVIKEILRTFPPAWAMSREAVQETTLGGAIVPAGTTVFLSMYAMQRHPDFWERPDDFVPERWLDNAPMPKAYFPFGAGARKCIGDHFAMMEMREVLLAFVRRLNWTFAEGQSFDLITPMTLNFKHPIQVQWTSIR